MKSKKGSVERESWINFMEFWVRLETDLSEIEWLANTKFRKTLGKRMSNPKSLSAEKIGTFLG